jgi:hypothetical protein
MQVLRTSYSSLGTFSSCPRKFEFDKLYPRRVRDDDNYAADVGSALHAGYQHYLVSGDKESSIWAFMQAFPFAGEFMQTNDYRSFEAALMTLETMMDEIRMDEYELARVKKPDGTIAPAIEVPFEIRFPGMAIAPCAYFPEGAGISIIGYIDAIMRKHTTGMFRSLDIKTSRMKLNDSTGKYKFDNQQVPYGIVIDHVAQGAVDSFEVLYLDCYIDLVEPRVEPYAFMKSQTDIQEWCTNKLVQFQQIQKFCAGEFFPRTDNGCLFYNKPCRYLEPCQTRERDALIEWFLMGDEPAKQEEFLPWIVADVNLGVE